MARTRRRKPAAPDTSCVPVPQPDGGYAVELRFRLDPGAPAEQIDALQRALRWRPDTITVQFAFEPRARGLRISGPDVGDVFTFATRVSDAIREIGDLIRDEPPPAAHREPPPNNDAARVTRDVSIDVTEQRWSYEPPGTFLPEPAPPTRAARARTAARALLRRVTGR
jgi:hypothetical protein